MRFHHLWAPLEKILAISGNTHYLPPIEKNPSDAHDGNGLFMHFATQITKQHECSKRKSNNINEHKLTACWWEYKNIKNPRFSKLVIVF